jgi:hypothetical protein
MSKFYVFNNLIIKIKVAIVASIIHPVKLSNERSWCAFLATATITVIIFLILRCFAVAAGSVRDCTQRFRTSVIRISISISYSDVIAHNVDSVSIVILPANSLFLSTPATIKIQQIKHYIFTIGKRKRKRKRSSSPSAQDAQRSLLGQVLRDGRHHGVDTVLKQRTRPPNSILVHNCGIHLMNSPKLINVEMFSQGNNKIKPKTIATEEQFK